MGERAVRIRLKNLLAITVGCAIFSFGLNYFTIANGLAEGGFTGITLLANYIFGFDPGLVNLLLNVPLFFIGWKVLGRTSMIYTIYGVVAVSVFLWVFKDFRQPLHGDLLLAALYAGVTLGLGLGLIFRYGGTTGGVDILARLAQKYLGWTMGRTMFLFDLFVIGASAYYIGREKAMYTLVAVFVATRVIDFVQEAAYSAKAALIVSDATADIARRILHEMDRGATLLKGKGGYTGTERDVLYVVVSRNEVQRLKALVHQVDPYAFVSIQDVRDVHGKGFTLDEYKRPIEG
ncbi:MAG: YitT family protein [Calditerricola sp.]|nr:YitT family protein [Calditerricola sp.]